MITSTQLLKIKNLCDDVEHESEIGAFIVNSERKLVTLYADKEDELIKDSYPHIAQDFRDLGIRFEVDYSKIYFTPGFDDNSAVVSWGTFIGEVEERVPLDINEYVKFIYLHHKLKEYEEEDEVGY